MKSISILTLITLVVLMNCSSSDDPSPQQSEEEQQLTKLAGTWVPGTVVYQDDDVTDKFSDFALTLTKSKTYTTSGNLGDYDYEPFKATGTWDFENDDLNVITRNDGVDMMVQVSENSLSMVFTTTEANGRIAGLGSYRFDLVKQ